MEDDKKRHWYRAFSELTDGQRLGFGIWGLVAFTLVGIGVVQSSSLPVTELDAQISMAVASWVMAIVSAVTGLTTVAFAAWAAFSSRATARAAIDANAQSRELFAFSQRAIVRLHIPKPTSALAWTATGPRLDVELGFQNVGATSAERFWIHASSVIIDPKAPLPAVDWGPEKWGIEVTPQETSTVTVTLPLVVPPPSQEPQPTNVSFIVFVRAAYSSGIDKRRDEVSGAYQLELVPDPAGATTIETGVPVPAHRMFFRLILRPIPS